MSAEKKTIVLGHVYSVAVGGSYLPVRADKSLGHGRYEGTTVRPEGAGATVKFSTDRVRGDGMPEAEWRARRAAKPAEEAPQPAEKAEPAKTKATGKAAAEPQRAKPAKVSRGKKATVGMDGKPSRRPSGLDAAVAVLAEAGKPLNCGDMVKRMLETGLWKTNGKTPAATIYAAIIREIAAKGGDSRFRKTDRGTFELTAAGIAARTAAGKEVG